MRAWKLDLWIALGALLVSALTASAAIYQSKVFSDQLSATVWPYISYVTTVSSNSSFELKIENDGAGPAIIRGAELLIDGKAASGTQQIVGALHYRPSLGSSSTTGDVSPGEVIRSGDSKTILRVRDPAFAKLISQINSRVTLRIYYCSILNRCWVAKTHSGSNDAGGPTDIKASEIPLSSIRW
jgi:hypothetical protein